MRSVLALAVVVMAGALACAGETVVVKVEALAYSQPDVYGKLKGAGVTTVTVTLPEAAKAAAPAPLLEQPLVPATQCPGGVCPPPVNGVPQVMPAAQPGPVLAAVQRVTRPVFALRTAPRPPLFPRLRAVLFGDV